MKRTEYYREKVVVLAFAGAISLVLLVIGSYQLYTFTESTAFCGELCHQVMNPEYTVYQASPHSRVACVNCHVGPGGSYFIKSKFSGLRQVVSSITGSYHRPILTPVENLRPARDTCEQCHRPGVFSGDLVRAYTTYDVNEANTQHSINMVLKVGAGGKETARDIHWHIAAKVWYLPMTEQFDEIGWVGVETKSGLTEYTNPIYAGEITPQRITKEKRLMDCIDCHNRATHIFKSPENLIDEAMSEGRIDSSLPYIKREGLSALGAINSSLEVANSKVNAIAVFYKNNYPTIYRDQNEAIVQAIIELKQIALLTTFPEMRVDYQTHLNNVGHNQSAGCFRCHGILETKNGENKGTPVVKDCNTCHYNPGPAGPLKPAVQIPHSIAGLQDCLSCHDPAGTRPFPADHVGRSNVLCLSCHQPSDVDTPPSPPPLPAPQIPHSITGLNGCLSCHDAAAVKPYPANHVGRTNELCLYCHNQTKLITPPPNPPTPAIQIPHSVNGLSDCYSCHGPGSKQPYPANHVGRVNAQCTICHSPPVLTAPPPATPPQAKPIPHGVSGLENCLLCHGPGSVRPYPANHVGRTNGLCGVCHTPSGVAVGPFSPPPAISIPHSIIGLSNCLSCHSLSGAVPFPANHSGRTNTQCTICHTPANITPPISVPAAPSGLTATAASGTQVDLAWTDNSDNETGFKVQRAADSGFSASLSTFTVGANVTTYSNTGLTAGITYYYRVLATNTSGDSAASNTATITIQVTPVTAPAAPSGLTATAVGSSQVDLAWTDNSDNETGFKIQRATNSGFTAGLTTFNVGPNITTYSNTGLTASTTYYYRVLATNNVGDSAASNSASATTQAPTAPAAPSGLTATAASSNQINLTWTDNSNNETGFKVQRATNSGFTAGLTTFNVGENVIVYSSTGLNSSTTYYYRVLATNTVGDSAASNSASATTQAPPVTVPAAPSGLTATAASSTQVDLAWTDNSNNETGFKVQRATNSGFTAGLTTFNVGPNVTTYSNTGLTAGNTYYYRVLATNNVGDSAASNSASVSTTPAPTLPAAPSGLTATAASSTQINLTWTDNSNNETGFKVQRATNSGFTAGLTTFNIGANVTTYSNTGLTASTTYYYRVLATNTVGDSAVSGTASATTQGTALNGQALFNSRCTGCHGFSTASRTNMTQAQLITWIPGHNTGSSFTPAEAAAVAAYIKP
jgi:predicted CXXCH cytochrome family protein